MVVIQVKRSETDTFIVESTVLEPNDALVRRLVRIMHVACPQFYARVLISTLKGSRRVSS